MKLTDEQIEQIRREEFVRGYVEALREFGSGCAPAVTLAHRAYNRTKR